MLTVELSGPFWRVCGRLGDNGKVAGESPAHEVKEGNGVNTENWSKGHRHHTTAKNLAVFFAIRVLEI